MLKVSKKNYFSVLFCQPNCCKIRLKLKSLLKQMVTKRKVQTRNLCKYLSPKTQMSNQVNRVEILIMFSVC